MTHFDPILAHFDRKITFCSFWGVKSHCFSLLIPFLYVSACFRSKKTKIQKSISEKYKVKINRGKVGAFVHPILPCLRHFFGENNDFEAKPRTHYVITFLSLKDLSNQNWTILRIDEVRKSKISGKWVWFFAQGIEKSRFDDFEGWNFNFFNF